MNTDFEPSKGVSGYSTEELQVYLSSLTNGSYSTQGQAYWTLCNTLLADKNRRFVRYSHYIPGMEYSKEELEQFKRHYGYHDLDRVHRDFELYYPLDPSFIELVNWLRSDQAPDFVINYLCEMFRVDNKQELFEFHYLIDNDLPLNPEIDIVRLIERPEDYLYN